MAQLGRDGLRALALAVLQQAVEDYRHLPEGCRPAVALRAFLLTANPHRDLWLALAGVEPAVFVAALRREWIWRTAKRKKHQQNRAECGRYGGKISGAPDVLGARPDAP